MITGKEDLLTALGEAYLMEKETRLFYKEAAEKAVNEDAKRTFDHLSGWEEQHMEYIMTLYKGLMEDWALVTFEEFRKRPAESVTEAGIPLKDLEGKITTYCVTDEMGALNLAMEIEGKAYNLYHRLSKETADTNARIIFREMTDQEKKHVTYLKELRVKLADVYNS